MDWNATDFIVAGALIAAVVVTFVLTVRKTTNVAYRAGVGVALAAAFLLVWANGAVGIIGNSGNDANMMYAGVVGIALVGAIVAGFRPRGMAFAMCATATAQALVAIVALGAGLGAEGTVWPWDIVVSTFFFAALWLLAAWFFRGAGREPLAHGEGTAVSSAD